MLMKFEWLKELLAEIEDSHCRCHEGFTSRDMADPACQVHEICGEIIERISDRISLIRTGNHQAVPYLDDAIDEIRFGEDG